EGTRIDIIETEAHLSTAIVKELEAQTALEGALANLKQLTGYNAITPQAIHLLNSNSPFNILSLPYQQFDEWQSAVIRHNPQLKVWQKQIELAQYDIERQKAGHLPKLEFYASQSVSKSNTSNTVDQRY